MSCSTRSRWSWFSFKGPTIVLVGFLCIPCFFVVPSADAYRFKVIAKTGDVISGKILSGFGGCAMSVNDFGTVAFVAQFDGGTKRGVFVDGALMAAPGDTIDDIPLTGIVARDLSLNNSGKLAFTGVSGQQTYIFTQGGRVSSTLYGWPNEGGEYRWSQFYGPSISDSGEVASRRGSQGIFKDDQEIVGVWDIIDGKRLTGNLSGPSMNTFGTVVFMAEHDTGLSAIFTERSLLLDTGDKVDGVTLTGFGDPSINDSGIVVFRATFDDGPSEKVGIFTQNRLIATTSHEGSGTPGINNAGEVVFWDSGRLFSQHGLIVEPGITIGGKTLKSLGDLGPSFQARPAINNLGQVMFKGNYSGGEMIVLASPDRPKADFRVSPELPYLTQEAKFDASLSTGNIVNWHWDFGDGATASGKEVHHTYNQYGHFRVVLAVTDIRNQVDRAGKTVIRSPDQRDGDEDGSGDVGDNRPSLANPDQRDTDGDGPGEGSSKSAVPDAGDVMSFFKESIREESLAPDAKTRRSQRRRRKAMKELLEKAQGLIERGADSSACAVLADAYGRIDGEKEPLPDWFIGPARPVLANMLRQVINQLGCGTNR